MARGSFEHGQWERLEKAYQQLRVVDRRGWQARRQARPAAEAAGYQTTVNFEPSGGRHHVVAKRFGWNNSQPLDTKHSNDYDLAKASGRRLLCNVVNKHWPYLTMLVFPCTVWSMLNNFNAASNNRRRQEENHILMLVLRAGKILMGRGRYFLAEHLGAATAS